MLYPMHEPRRSFVRCLQCLLDQLLLSRDDQGEGMGRSALRDELMTLLVAGQETSAILLAWACAFLAHYPEKQERAASEAQQVRLAYALPLVGYRLGDASQGSPVRAVLCSVKTVLKMASRMHTLSTCMRLFDTVEQGKQRAEPSEGVHTNAYQTCTGDRRRC